MTKPDVPSPPDREGIRQEASLRDYVQHKIGCGLTSCQNCRQTIGAHDNLRIMGYGVCAKPSEPRCTCGLEQLLALSLDQPREEAKAAFVAGWEAAKRDEDADDETDIADAPDVAWLDYQKRGASVEPREEAWREIATAPKDGTPFFVYWPESLTGEPNVEKVTWNEYVELLGFGEPPATHWMPSPLPPRPEQG